PQASPSRGARQSRLRAKALAAVSLPTPSGPVKSQAWCTLPCRNADWRRSTARFCPRISDNLTGAILPAPDDRVTGNGASAMNHRRISLLPLVFVFLSCASVTRTIDKGTGAVGEVLLPVSEEARLGKQLADEVNKQEKIHPDAQVQAYVAKVGRRIVDASRDRRKGITYRFTVIDQPRVINAFALPGGHIYVYSGLILAARSEAELASVLGHEVGHVTSR